MRWRNPRTAVVAGRGERFEAELLHHLDHVLAHFTEGIGKMVVTTFRLRTVAIASDIRRHHGELPRQLGRDAVPGQMCKGIAVHQQQRRPASAVAQNNVHAVHMKRFLFEAFHHVGFVLIAGCRRPAVVSPAGCRGRKEAFRAVTALQFGLLQGEPDRSEDRPRPGLISSCPSEHFRFGRRMQTFTAINNPDATLGRSITANAQASFQS
jgi:hypothetical protein